MSGRHSTRVRIPLSPLWGGWPKWKGTTKNGVLGYNGPNIGQDEGELSRALLGLRQLQMVSGKVADAPNGSEIHGR